MIRPKTFHVSLKDTKIQSLGKIATIISNEAKKAIVVNKYLNSPMTNSPLLKYFKNIKKTAKTPSGVYCSGVSACLLTSRNTLQITNIFDKITNIYKKILSKLQILTKRNVDT